MDRFDHRAGELSEHELKTGSGATQIIVRCANCGTPVWSHYRLGRKAAAVRGWTLHDPSAVGAGAATFVTDKPECGPLPEGVPQSETYSTPAELLPPERFARLQAL